MTLRVDYRIVAPDAVNALAGLNHYSDQCSISPMLRRLIEILVSQINGCTYCIGVHTRQSLELGEDPVRISSVVNWRVADMFSARETAAFAWSEAITEVSTSGVPDHLYIELQSHFSEIEIVDLTFVVLSMNAWNRLAISFKREAE